MIISNRFFSLQGPIRVDLSGNPFGFLFMWRPQADVSGGKFALVKGRHFGFELWSPLWLLTLFPSKYELLECPQLKIEGGDPAPHDWRQWPDGYRQACEAAVARAVNERPGSKIILDRSRSDRRIDLTGEPVQFYRSIVLKKAAMIKAVAAKSGALQGVPQ